MRIFRPPSAMFTQADTEPTRNHCIDCQARVRVNEGARCNGCRRRNSRKMRLRAALAERLAGRFSGKPAEPTGTPRELGKRGKSKSAGGPQR